MTAAEGPTVPEESVEAARRELARQYDSRMPFWDDCIRAALAAAAPILYERIATAILAQRHCDNAPDCGDTDCMAIIGDARIARAGGHQ